MGTQILVVLVPELSLGPGLGRIAFGSAAVDGDDEKYDCNDCACFFFHISFRVDPNIRIVAAGNLLVSFLFKVLWWQQPTWRQKKVPRPRGRRAIKVADDDEHSDNSLSLLFFVI